MATQQTAVTKDVIVNGTKLTFRRLGVDEGIPLVMLIHFRGNMDFWLPALINALARSRPIILLDNTGIEKSEGEIPTTLQGWASNVIALVEALRIPQIFLLGFSMGGGAAQHVALLAPGLVGKLILAGTRTVIGDRKIFTALATSVSEEECKASFVVSFFNPDPPGQAAAKDSLARIFSRTVERAPHMSIRKFQTGKYHEILHENLGNR